MPKTGLGKWAGGLLVAFLVFAAAVILGTTRLGLQAGTPGLVILGISASCPISRATNTRVGR